MDGLSCSTACGIFLDQGSNMRPLHWQVDPILLSHLGSPKHFISNLDVQETNSSCLILCVAERSILFLQSPKLGVSK